VAPIRYRAVDIDSFNVFYREAGSANAPNLLLLHGFPSAGHMFRDLIPLLADRFHIVAPDLPGFGQSDMPPREKFKYTFDNIARVIERFTEVIGLDRFAVYVFDYGAPTGFRLAVRHPERITAIVSQNGNAYEEGLSEGWTPIKAYWQDPSEANRKALRAFLTPETTRWQYTHGVPDQTIVRRTGRTSTTSIWLVQALMKSSSTCLAITRATLRCIHHFRIISARISHRCWPCGARTIRSLFRPALRHSSATIRTRWCDFSTLATSHWKHTRARSRTAFAIS
jgi:pimeloyl-ACP methyl ester carboxylesterase